MSCVFLIALKNMLCWRFVMTQCCPWWTHGIKQLNCYVSSARLRHQTPNRVKNIEKLQCKYWGKTWPSSGPILGSPDLFFRPTLRLHRKCALSLHRWIFCMASPSVVPPSRGSGRSPQHPEPTDCSDSRNAAKHLPCRLYVHSPG